MTKSNDNGPSMTVRAVWLVCGRLLASVFSFALPLLLVRRLSQHDFGVYKQVFLIVGTAMTALPMGFGMSAFYFLPREHDRRSLIVLNILLGKDGGPVIESVAENASKFLGSLPPGVTLGVALILLLYWFVKSRVI